MNIFSLFIILLFILTLIFVISYDIYEINKSKDAFLSYRNIIINLVAVIFLILFLVGFFGLMYFNRKNRDLDRIRSLKEYYKTFEERQEHQKREQIEYWREKNRKIDERIQQERLMKEEQEKEIAKNKEKYDAHSKKLDEQKKKFDMENENRLLNRISLAQIKFEEISDDLKMINKQWEEITTLDTKIGDQKVQKEKELAEALEEYVWINLLLKIHNFRVENLGSEKGVEIWNIVKANANINLKETNEELEKLNLEKKEIDSIRRTESESISLYKDMINKISEITRTEARVANLNRMIKMADLEIKKLEKVKDYVADMLHRKI